MGVISHICSFSALWSLFFLALVIFALFPQIGISAEPRLSLTLDLYGRGNEEELRRGRVVGTEVGAQFQTTLTDTVRARLQGGVRLETGSVQTFFPDDFAVPRSQVRLQAAYVSWEPLREIALSAGVFPQTRWKLPVLLGDVSFPGLGERASVKLGRFALGLEAEQTVPTTVFGAPEGATASQGSLPLLFVERITARLGENGYPRAELAGGHYHFLSLDDTVAYQGRFLGNTVEGAGRGNARFVHSYGGVFASLGGSIPVNAWLEPSLSAHAIENLLAPRDQSRAYFATLALAVGKSEGFRLTPLVTYFYTESDASPAYYGTRSWGAANRKGFEIGVDAGERTDWSLGLRYASGDPLTATPYQSHFQRGSIQLGVSHDVL